MLTLDTARGVARVEGLTFPVEGNCVFTNVERSFEYRETLLRCSRIARAMAADARLIADDEDEPLSQWEAMMSTYTRKAR